MYLTKKQYLSILGLIVFCLSSASISARQKVSFKKTKLSETITLSLPKTFRPMTDDEVVAEYAVYRKPLAMYIDAMNPVHLGVNVSASRWQNSDLAMLKSFYKATLLDLYSDVDFIQEELVKIGDYQFVVFEFTSSVKPTEKEQSIIEVNPIRRYYYLQYTVVEGQVMLFNFNCPIRLQPRWAPVAKEIMQSVDLK